MIDNLEYLLLWFSVLFVVGLLAWSICDDVRVKKAREEEALEPVVLRDLVRWPRWPSCISEESCMESCSPF
jgi:hypothetical protein